MFRIVLKLANLYEIFILFVGVLSTIESTSLKYLGYAVIMVKNYSKTWDFYALHSYYAPMCGLNIVFQ